MAQKDFVDDAIEKLSHKSHRKGVTSADLPFIFKLESEVREIVELSDSAVKAHYENIYEETVRPLLEKAKIFIRNHPIHYSVQAAAEKGKAAVVGQEVLKKVGDINRLKPNVASAQEVFLFPQHGAVLKRMDLIAKEESHNVDELLNIMAKGAVVGTFEFKEEDVEAKPFVQMVLMGDLMEMPLAEQKVFERLSPDAQFIGCLTAELQLLDLHGDNLAVAPDIARLNLERFSDFKLDGKAVSLNALILAYLNDDIDPMSAITYKDNGKTVKKKLENLPKEIKEAFEASWKFVLFDTDQALGESNNLQFQLVGKEQSHLIPLRSCLLGSPGRDMPLSDETVERLQHSQERDSLVKKWAERADSAVMRHLPDHVRAEVRGFITEKAREFSLTEMRTAHDYGLTFKEIQEHFVASLSEYSKENRPFWRTLQSHLQFGDLCSNTEEAGDNRVRVAMQLFPRLTVLQQEALYDRLASRDAYLTGYARLKDATGANTQIRAIQHFFNSCGTIFSTPRKLELELDFKEAKKSPVDIARFRDRLLEEVQPTYFNLAKAMYPLLADVFELAVFAYGEEDGPASIGHFEYPIEGLLEDVRKKCAPSSTMGKLATSVEETIKLVENPSFFAADSGAQSEEKNIFTRFWNNMLNWLP